MVIRCGMTEVATDRRPNYQP